MHLKIREKVEISSTPYDVEGGWKGVLQHRKGEVIISHFELIKSKILSVQFGVFKKFVRQRIERSEARGTARDKLKHLEFPG